MTKKGSDMEAFSRSALLLGDEAMARIQAAHICVIGLGGVGSYVTEALARGGVGALTLVDADLVSDSNRNRQLCALCSTVGKPKAEVLAARVKDINPDCKVTALPIRYTGKELDLSAYTYIADAIDSVEDKLNLLENAAKASVPILSCMGTGNKLDPMGFRVCDLEKTSECPLAKRIRIAMRKRGVRHLQVVFSPESPVQHLPTGAKPQDTDALHPVRPTIGSVPWVPPAAGLLMAGTILQAIAANQLIPPSYIPNAN